MKQLPWWRRPYFVKQVLDIGAGHNPFHGVTHVLDYDVHEGRERGHSQVVVPRSARLIVGNATDLPFQTGAFDYVYASHILEHVNFPDRACQEIMRVGRAGYIETPSPFLEQGLGLGQDGSSELSFHRWLVFSPSHSTLVFEPKSLQTLSEFCSCQDGQFMRQFYQSVDFKEAQHFFRRKTKTTIFYWKDRFVAEVRDRTADCRLDGVPCRFQEMRKTMVANCSDVIGARRIVKLAKRYPECRKLFKEYGHWTLFV